MANFRELIRKQGETVEHYVHSFESSRDSTTNLKESQWATAIEIKALVRSQPENSIELSVGIYNAEILVILMRGDIDAGGIAPSRDDVLKWQDKYYDIIIPEAMYFNKAKDYYKCTCMRRVEFLGV